MSTRDEKPWAHISVTAYSLMLNDSSREAIDQVRIHLQLLDEEHSGQVPPASRETVVGWLVSLALRRPPNELAAEIWEHMQEGEL